MIKLCPTCGVTKPTTEFYKRKDRRDGLRYCCKACTGITVAGWRKANLDKKRAINTKYRSANRDKVREGIAKWVAANPEKVKTYNTEWRAANPETVRVYKHNRRARKREAGGRLSPGLSARLLTLQRGKCACGCKQPLGEDYHMDHIMPLALGGSNTDENIQLLRKTCNLHKHAKHPVDFMQQRGFLL